MNLAWHTLVLSKAKCFILETGSPVTHTSECQGRNNPLFMTHWEATRADAPVTRKTAMSAQVEPYMYLAESDL